ncbi:MAG: T9SS type A sorting domain-containing protein [Saprospiraceae bacterium]
MTRLMSIPSLLQWGKLSCLSFLFFLASFLHVNAATFEITSNTNWSTFILANPGTTHDIIVRSNVTLTIDQAATCQSLQIGSSLGSGQQQGTVNILAGIQLTVSGVVTIGSNTTGNNKNGTLTLATTSTLACVSLIFGIDDEPNLLTQSAGSTVTVSTTVIINQPNGNNTTHSWNVNTGTATATGLITLAEATATASRKGQIAITSGTLNANGGISFEGSTAATKVINMTGAGTLNIGGSGITSGSSGTLTADDGTVNYNGAGAQVVGAYVYNNLTLSGSGAKTVTGATVNGTLSRQGTATATGTSPTYGASATLAYAGTAAQTTSDVEFNGAGGPPSLTINNANGVTLHAARSISGTLTLTAGNLITTSANLLTFTGSTLSGGSKDSYIDGPLAKTGSDVFTFHVGKSGIYAPIAISAPTSSSTFQGEYFLANPQTAIGATKVGSIDHISALEYWVLNQTAGTGNVTVNLSWRATSNVTDPASIIVARHDGSTWQNEGQSAINGSASLGDVTSNNVTSFSPFTLASTLGGAFNPLPVELTSFTAQKKEKGVLLEWETAVEENNAFFQVERSIDGKQFAAIGKVEGVGSSDVAQIYQLMDEKPRQGTNYYRLKQVDFDGTFEYHPIVSVEVAAEKEVVLQLFPNPAVDKVNVFVPSQVEGVADIKIFNALGQLVKTTRKDLIKGNNMEEIPVTGLPMGKYTVTLDMAGQRLAQAALVIQ